MPRQSFHPRRPVVLTVIVAVMGLAWLCPLAHVASADDHRYPRPALYPESWQLDFEAAIPQRIVVEVPGRGPQAYWYLTYTVTNRTDREQLFMPVFELLTHDGNVYRSDRGVPAVVFDRIKQREKKPLLEPFHQIAGTLLVGEDQARDGVAIWQEPPGRMGAFSIFVEGLSGETATVKLGERDVILRKQLQLNFHIRGDEFFRGEDDVNPADDAETWVMR